MISVFYISSIIAVLASLKVISSTVPISALLYLIISLLASAAIFFSLGAYFSTAMQILLFVSAVAILFLSVISFLDLNTIKLKQQEKRNLSPKTWLGPFILIFILFVMLLFSIVNTNYEVMESNVTGLQAFSIQDSLLGPYILVIELAGLLILGAVVVAYHFANSVSLGPELVKDERQYRAGKQKTIFKKGKK